jgi:hypothetical protein
VRFAFAHKLSTYIMVVCAYAALALGGFLDDVWVMGALLGIAGSWFWEPPRVDLARWGKLWTGVALAVFVYSALTVIAGRDILLSGAEFLMFLTVVKLFNRRACKDYQHVYVLTFLMLVAGTVLNYEISYGFFFVGFVVASTWALILFHLRREMEDNFLLKHTDTGPTERVEVTRILNSRRIVGGKFFAGTAAASLVIFLFASLIFMLIPRIGFGFFFQKNRGALHMAGFSDGVQLGGHGVIKDNRTVVMRVKVDDAYQGRKAPYIHWRGVAFDEYQSGRWNRTPRAPLAGRVITYADGKVQHHMTYDGRVSGALVDRMKRGLRQEIYLEPLGNSVLFGASMPLTYELGKLAGGGRARQGRNDELRQRHTQGIKYVVYSQPSPPPPRVLRQPADHSLPDGYHRAYLQWPKDEITAETVELARQITAPYDNNYDKAVAVERWLKENLSYTLRMQSPDGQEPIHFFLFDRRAGHCEYFSSAMAIMLRTQGIPTRNVNGFLGGEWNEYDDYIAVRAGDAHSWVEVYFPDHGWVTFDPTPSAEVDRMGRGGGGFLDKARRFFDNLRFQWFQWVIEYDIYNQLSIFKAIGDKLKGGGRGARSAFDAVKAWVVRHKWSAAGVGLGLLALAIGVGLWRRRREARRGSSATGDRRGRRKPIAGLYNATLDYLRRRGYARPPARTPREHAAELTARGAPGAAAFAELTRLYYAAEYGTDGDGDVDRAEELAAAIRDAFAAARRGRRAA